MLDKEFVPYQESLELKGLEFDEGCFALYNKYGGFIYEPQTFGKIIYKSSLDILKVESVLAPTFSQAFRWFRKKYGLVIQYIPFELDNEEGQSILHHKHKISEYDSWRGGRRNTIETELCDDYEEAELACLRKLIEIVKK